MQKKLEVKTYTVESMNISANFVWSFMAGYGPSSEHIIKHFDTDQRVLSKLLWPFVVS